MTLRSLLRAFLVVPLVAVSALAATAALPLAPAPQACACRRASVRIGPALPQALQLPSDAVAQRQLHGHADRCMRWRPERSRTAPSHHQRRASTARCGVSRLGRRDSAQPTRIGTGCGVHDIIVATAEAGERSDNGRLSGTSAGERLAAMLMARNVHMSTCSPGANSDGFMNMSPVSTSGRQTLALTFAATESEHPASATTGHSVHNADSARLTRQLTYRLPVAI